LASVTLKRSRAYLRKASDYKRAYRMLNEGHGVGTAAQYAEIEKMRALVKTHRCTFNQEYKFIAISSIIQADILGHWGFF
jgi:glucan phosphorylase